MKQKNIHLKSITEPKSFSFNENSYSEILLKNCGFPQKFFEQIDQNIKIYENRFNQKIDEKQEDSTINPELCKNHKSLDNETSINNMLSNNNCSNAQTNFSSNFLNNNNILDDFEKVGKQKKTQNDSKENKNFFIKSYKSKYKIKNKIIYEQNSFDVKKLNKDKLFHKCCYPGCNRTFSSSGWLRTHYSEHLQEIHSSAYCKLFEEYLSSEKFNLINNIENFYYSKINTNNNNNTNYKNFLYNNRNINVNNNNHGSKKNFFYPFLGSCFDYHPNNLGCKYTNKYDTTK